eukprot:scaffold168237_cov32-Prasinocladus_malaysianus.AAC.1
MPFCRLELVFSGPAAPCCCRNLVRALMLSAAAFDLFATAFRRLPLALRGSEGTVGSFLTGTALPFCLGESSSS